MQAGQLVLAGTPIGNIDDATPRLRQALQTADLIAAEDTRKLRKLLSMLEIKTDAQLVSYYDQVEIERIPQLLAALDAGRTVVVVSDAGMPTVSDPGFRIAQAAAERGIAVSALPGPSAVTTALALSGLPSDRFCFEGFLSRKAGERGRQLAALAREPRTMIFFESTHRIADTTAAMVEAFGGSRRAALCRELTKTYEQVIRGTLAELADRCQSEVLGEITLVIAGADPAAAVATDDEVLAQVAQLVSAGVESKAAISEVAQRVGRARREVFDLVVAAKNRPK